MNRKQKIIVSVTGIFLVLLILMGLTYAYFLIRINGNKNNQSIGITTANLAVSWINGTTNKIESKNAILPGEFTSSMDFQVENTGNGETDYEVILRNLRIKWTSTVADTIQVAGVDTYLEHPEDMEMTITCKSYDTTSDRNYTNKEESGTCSGKVGTLPTTNDVLVSNKIPVGKTHVYEVTINYVDDGSNQSADMNKSISGLIDIRDPKESVDIEGYISNYQPGDIVQSNSIERISTIDKNGKYKILGLEFDNHTISIRNKTSVLTSKSISIEKGQSSNISGNNITTTDDERVINIDANRNGSISVLSTKSGNKYTEGTLALNFKSGNKIDFTTNKPVEDVDIKRDAISYPFTIENIGKTHQNITIKLTDIEMDEDLKHVDFRWGLYNAKTGNGLSFGIFKYTDSEELIYTDTIIDAGDPSTNKDYILRIWLHNNGTPQSELLNKKFKANISVTGETIEYTPEECFNITSDGAVSYNLEFVMDDETSNLIPDPNSTCPTDKIAIPKTVNGIQVKKIAPFSQEDLGYYLRNLIIPNTVVEIEDGAFSFLYGFNITIPESVVTMGYAFEMFNGVIRIPETVTSAEFGNYSGTYIIIPGSLKIAPNLTAGPADIILMDGITNINTYTFSSTSSSYIEIPKSVEVIKYSAFDCNNSLQTIVLRGKTEVPSGFEPLWNCNWFGYDDAGEYCEEYINVIYRP